jgi:hypothetical protein
MYGHLNPLNHRLQLSTGVTTRTTKVRQNVGHYVRQNAFLV